MHKVCDLIMGVKDETKLNIFMNYYVSCNSKIKAYFKGCENERTLETKKWQHEPKLAK